MNSKSAEDDDETISMEGNEVDDEEIDDEDDVDEDNGFEYENVDALEKMTFDFEAFPPDPADNDGLVDLMTQIFLRVNIDCEAIAKRVIEMSPFGCIFRPAEECEDEDVGSLVYGVVSIIDLIGEEKYLVGVRDFLFQRAKKYATKESLKSLEKLFSDNSTKRLGMILNERMIHFPAAIAGPAFRSLKEDLKNLPKNEQYNNLLMILKIRASDTTTTPNTGAGTSNSGPSQPKRKKKLGKAEKKRLAAAKLASADLIFDNPEEQLLFETIQPIYFQYPVESDVEKGSKFHTTIRDGVVYRPYRRVCLLSIDQFNVFADAVVNGFSS